MASPKLTGEQRSTLLEWLAADYDWRLIRQWFIEREWPEISRNAIYYYRTSRNIGIARLRAERQSNALNSGLALKEERVARLKTNADKLEAIKWFPDKNGKMVNEKAWRECLADIAAEMGHRKIAVEFDLSSQIEKKLEELGLTYEDVAKDPLAARLFGLVTGKRIAVVGEETGANSGRETESGTAPQRTDGNGGG